MVIELHHLEDGAGIQTRISRPLHAGMESNHRDSGSEPEQDARQPTCICEKAGHVPGLGQLYPLVGRPIRLSSFSCHSQPKAIVHDIPEPVARIAVSVSDG